MKSLAIKGYYIYCFIFLVLLIAIGKHISSLVDLIWNNPNEASDLYLDKLKNQSSIIAGTGDFKFNNETKEHQLKDDNTRSFMSFKGSPFITSINQNLDKFSNQNGMAVVNNNNKGEEKTTKKEFEDNFVIEEKKF